MYLSGRYLPMEIAMGFPRTTADRKGRTIYRRAGLEPHFAASLSTLARPIMLVTAFMKIRNRNTCGSSWVIQVSSWSVPALTIF